MKNHVMEKSTLLDLYRVMFTARQIDLAEHRLSLQGEAFFHLSGAGHEATAALAFHLTKHDWLHSHYRSRALLLARGLTIRDFFDSLLCKDRSSSRGRRMGAFFSDPKLHILSMVTPVGNNCLQSVGVAAASRNQHGQPVVICGLGDGTTQQGEFLEACGEAARQAVPVLFLIENNGLAISTPTRGKTFFAPAMNAARFQGIPILQVNGRDVEEVYARLGEVVAQMRWDRCPAIVVLDVERLASHTNADDQRVYRSDAELRQAECGDPLRLCEVTLRERGITASQIADLQQEVIEAVNEAEAAALEDAEPQTETTARLVIPIELTHASREYRGDDREPELTMRDALRAVLRSRLQSDARVNLFGEDIEDPKGDVFGVTRGLSTEFPDRVCNSPLSESTIVGVSIGRALAGERPVAFIQFADFLPLAYNQIASELATIYWRTAGRWNSPVILMVACGGYRPGLGPYHAQTFEGTLAHIPGIDVLMPSTAADAAGLLNAAFQSQRPTIFLYPKALLNDPQDRSSADVRRLFVPIGPARRVRAGRDLTLVGWGNTVRLCAQAAQALEQTGVETEVIDLRSLSPWDERTVLASAEKTARLIVVHEDNHTCGMGAEVLATIAEKARVPVATRRVTRPDTHVPCNFANQIEVLPSYQRLLTTAAELLDLDLSWVAPPEQEAGIAIVEAIGSSPSDETVIVAELHVQAGQTLERGDVIASLEATKSIFEMTATVSGVVDDLLVAEGQTIPVGQPMLRVRTKETQRRKKPVTQERAGTPVLRRRPNHGRLILPRTDNNEPRRFDVGISTIAAVEGSRVISNAEIVPANSGYDPSDVLRRTGIEQRRWIGPGEDAISLAVAACRQVLDQESLILDDLDMIVCSTTSPLSVTPSMACRVMNGLAGSKGELMIQAFDINAACSGYLYALQAAYDYLQSTPHGRVLVVTTEVLSPLLDREDFDTAILFGDAASATILYGESHYEAARARLHRPDLSAKGDVGGALSVPLRHGGFIQMQGRKVFTEAVRSMITSLSHACQRRSLTIDQLDLIVPHQANQRIIDAIQRRISTQVYSNIRHHGNTSSTSIPLCLTEVIPAARPGDLLGLCAFGGGFTFGAGIVEMN